MDLVFLDSNVPMYLVGADHPNKVTCITILSRLVSENVRLVTDVEVFQEILHRYTAINRPEAIQPAFDAMSSVVDDIYSLDLQSVISAKDLILSYPGLSARDAIHLAIMRTNGIKTILTFDRGFDQVQEITVLKS